MEQLIAATEALLRRLDDEAVGRFLALWPQPARPTRRLAARTLPVLRWLAPACADGRPDTADVLHQLCALASTLHWGQTYTAAQTSPQFLDRYGWTELIGLRGPVPSERLAAGFLLLGQETIYPPHRHAAEELYLPLGGRAAWQRGTEPWRDRPAGGLIHHAPWQRHAMRTAEAPLLALYLWCGGDLAQASRLD